MLKKILVISPHIDDVELAMGGTVARWVSEGHDVYYVALSDCQDTFEGTKFPKNTLVKECQKALGILGVPKNRIFVYHHTNKQYASEARAIFEDLEALREKIKPDLIAIPTPTDTHQDHKTVAKQAITVFRRSTSIITYEQPWNTTEFRPDFFVRLSQKQVDAKLRALKQYKSQQAFKKSYFAPDFLRSWSRTRGMHINTKYAEAFRVIKWIE